MPHSVRPLQFAAILQATLQSLRPLRYGSSILVGASLLGLWSLPVQAADIDVLHAEPIAITLEDGSNVADVNDARKSALDSVSDGTARHLKFDAFGRRFALDLDTHAELNQFAAKQGSSAIALRGALRGNSNSWVRITQSGAQTRGLIWDGNELFAIEPNSDLPGSEKSAKGTVVFRLSDTKTELGPDSCGATGTDKEPSGAAYYANFQKEFSAAKYDTEEASVSHRLLLSAIMDASFEQQFPTAEAAADALVARINNIDGIFTAQLGVTISLTEAVPASSAIASRLSTTTSADNLLTSLSRVRGSESKFFGTGVTHLFTGRDLDGNTIGISYVGAVCGTSYGAALSESRGRGAWIDSLIAAHELGHSFGASHDGSGECADTPTTYLMAPSIAGWDRFSQCSLKRMKSRMESASCLVPVPKTDIAIAQHLGDYRAAIDKDIAWSMSVANLGATVTQDVRLQIYVPSQLTISNAPIANGICSVGAGVVDCVLTAMAPAEVRKIELPLHSTTMGTFSITAAASGSHDFDVSNNDGVGSVIIESTVSTPTSPSTGSGTPLVSDQPKDGGGGAWGWGWISVFAGLSAFARRFRAREA